MTEELIKLLKFTPIVKVVVVGIKNVEKNVVMEL